MIQRATETAPLLSSTVSMYGPGGSSAALLGTAAVLVVPVPVMGRSTRRVLVSIWWVEDIGLVSEALAMVPVALLIALGFAAVGMAVTSWFTNFQQMELINIVLLPMFMFSSTLFPIDIYPQPIQWFIMAMPLWHGVELMRQLSVGVFGPMTLVHLGYFGVMSVLGVAFCTIRLRALFLR